MFTSKYLSLLILGDFLKHSLITHASTYVNNTSRFQKASWHLHQRTSHGKLDNICAVCKKPYLTWWRCRLARVCFGVPTAAPLLLRSVCRSSEVSDRKVIWLNFLMFADGSTVGLGGGCAFIGMSLSAFRYLSALDIDPEEGCRKPAVWRVFKAFFWYMFPGEAAMMCYFYVRGPL